MKESKMMNFQLDFSTCVHRHVNYVANFLVNFQFESDEITYLIRLEYRSDPLIQVWLQFSDLLQ